MSDRPAFTGSPFGDDPASQAFIADPEGTEDPASERERFHAQAWYDELDRERMDDPEGTEEHRHTYASVWWYYGPHGPQDVHVHSCDGDGCDWVLIGPGRDCASSEGHEEHRLRSSPVGLKRPRPRPQTLTLKVSLTTPHDLRAFAATALGQAFGTRARWEILEYTDGQ